MNNIQQARNELLAQIEADHAEGEAIVATINNDIAAGIAHAEALEINAVLTQAINSARCAKATDDQISKEIPF